MVLVLALLACGDKDDGDSGGTTDGGAADGGSSDGGSTDGGAEGDCVLSDAPWTIASGEDTWAAFAVAAVDLSQIDTPTRHLYDYLQVVSDGLGTPLADLGCDEISFDGGTYVFDGADGCEIEWKDSGRNVIVQIHGRAEASPYSSYVFEDFSFSIEESGDGPYAFVANGDAWYTSGTDGQEMGAVLTYSLHADTSWYDYSGATMMDVLYTLDADGESESGEGFVEVIEGEDGGPTGSFCLEYAVDYPSPGTCDAEQDKTGTLSIQGAALGVLSFDAETECDGCYPFTLDGVEAAPYCP